MNVEKVRNMTSLAMYAVKNEKSVFKVEQFYGSDYVLWNMLLAFARYTVCAAVIAAVGVIFRSDVLFYNINTSGVSDTAKVFFEIYAAGLIIYLVITAFVYGARYKRARKGMMRYGAALRRLAGRYKLEE